MSLKLGLQEEIEGANDYINWLKHARLILNGPRIEMAIITER